MKLSLLNIADEVCRFGSDNKHVLLLITQNGEPLSVESVEADLEKDVVYIKLKDIKDKPI